MLFRTHAKIHETEKKSHGNSLASDLRFAFFARHRITRLPEISSSNIFPDTTASFNKIEMCPTACL